jgi:hypothetical protein
MRVGGVRVCVCFFHVCVCLCKLSVCVCFACIVYVLVCVECVCLFASVLKLLEILMFYKLS